MHLVFHGDYSYTTTNDLGGFTLNELVVNSAAGNTVRVAGDTSNQITFTRSSLAELPELKVSGAGNTTIAAPLVYSGNATVTNAGSGLLFLEGNQTFGLGTKQTFINAGSGTISLADDVTYSTTGSGTGLVLNFVNSNTAANSFNVGDLGGLTNVTFNVGGAGTVRFGGASVGDLFSGSAILNVREGAAFDFNANGEGMGAIMGAGTINIRGGVGVSIAGYYEVSGKLTGSTNSPNVTVEGGSHTLVLSGSASDYTGATTVNSGRLIVNANAPNGGTGVTGALGNATSEVVMGNTTGTANATLLIGKAGVSIGRNIRIRTGNTGIARLGGLNDSGTVTYSGNVIMGSNTAAAKGLTVQTTTGGTVAFTGNLLRASGATGNTDTLNVTGGGTAILGGANTFTGATTVSGGTLVLDYTVNNGSKLSQTASLTLNGGSLNVLGNSTGATNQTVSGLLLGNSTGVLGGGGRFVVIGGQDNDATVILGAITRNTAATIDFATVNTGVGTARIGTTTKNTSGGILGSYATFNRSDWAAVNGMDYITALDASSYTTSFGTGLHTSIGSNTGVTTGGATSHTLRITGTAAVTFATAADTLTLESGGVLVTPNAGATSIGSSSVRGNLASSTGEILIHQNSTAGALTVHSVISGATTVTKSGDGVLILTGTNTYTGGTYINGGTVQISASANLGAATSHVFINGATLIITGVNALPGAGTGTDGRQITIGSAGAILDVRANQSFQRGNIKGSGTLTKIGAGTMSFGSSSNTFNGDLVINEGVVLFNSNQLSSVGLITVNNGGTYEVNDDGTDSFNSSNNTPGGTRFVINGDGYQGNGAIRLTDQNAANTSPLLDPRTTLNREVFLQTTSRIQVDNGTSPGSFSLLRLTGNVTGTGGLVKTGAGGLELSARDNSYAGDTEVQNGILAINLGNDRLPTGTKVTLGLGGNSGVLKLNGFSQTIAGLTTSGSGVANAVIGGDAANTSLLEVKVASGSQNYAGSLGGTGTTFQAGNNHANNNLAFVKSGAGTLELSGASTYTGSTTVVEGTLVVSNNQALGAGGVGYAAGDGGTTVKSGATLDLNGQSNVYEVITLNGSGVGGGGALVNNNTSSVASVGGGIASFSVSSVTSTGWSANASVSIASPTFGMEAFATTQLGLTSATFTVTNGGTNFSLTNGRVNVIGGGGSGAVVVPVLGVTSDSYTVTSGTTTYSVAPTVTLQNGATGVAILDGNGKVVGITVTNAGTNFRAAPTVTFSGGIVISQGTDPTVTGRSDRFTVVAVEVVSAGTGYTEAPIVTITGNTGGIAAVAETNDTNFVLNGLALIDPGYGYTPDAPIPVTVSGGTATVTANASAIHLASDSSVGGAGDLILNPVITGEHALTKVGAGVTTLAEANTYTGGTTVSEGTLLATNFSGSATGTGNVTVASGATLGGTGYVGRAAGSAASPEANMNITVSSGAKLMVGKTHNQTIANDGAPSVLTLQTGGDGVTSGVISLLGTVQFDIYNRDPGVNSPLYANDLLVLKSANEVAINGVLQVRDTTSTSMLDWAIGDSWKLIDWAGVLPGVNHSGGFHTFELPDLALGLKWDTSQIYTTGFISVVVVPEPGRGVLFIVAFGAALLRRRRRRCESSS
ncbi:putative secreted protein with PEP-CTERM sorting signal [Roseimicrobium gellanilyticum]|uniref:Putative secreted protein with PEP-CTERM sorting signal n=2 Tax=Roseimicrobium gellanilyticum TaxID=748857 RepID=A0A366HFZ4_9BACT|nr:putative secreted protein with PEP-CTERM sorting signal [Roseimicrobium gellanilyticum]